MAEPEETPSVEPTEGNDEVKTDYESMTVEEIDAEFERTGGVNPQEESAEPEPGPAPEPVAAEPESTDKPEPQEESTPATTEDAPAEPEPNEQELQMQEMQLQMERIGQERQQFEHIAGRTTGEIGFLKKELERLRATPQVAQQDPVDYQAETPTVQPQPPSAPSRLEGQVAELQESYRASAVEKVYNTFLSHVEKDLLADGVKQDQIESEQTSIMEKINPTLKQRFDTFGDVSNLGTKATEKVTRMVLEGAYTDIKIAKIADLRKTFSERKAVQIAENKIAKQAASTSGSGGRPVQESPPKSIEDMTAEEADAELIRLSGEGIYRSRR